MERVLVVGGTGFIGRRIVTALTSFSGASPVAASRFAPPRRFGMRWRECDATNLGHVGQLMEDFDSVVICLAGKPASFIKSCRNVLKAASMARIRRVIFISSMAAYGNRTGAVDEETPLGPDGNSYSGARAAAERLVGEYLADGNDAVVLRPSCVYGAGSQQWTGRIGRLLRTGRLGDLGAAGDGFCNLIHVDDLAAAVVTALWQEGICGERINMSSSEILTWNAYMASMANAIGVENLRVIGAPQLLAECYVAAPWLKIAEAGSRLFRKRQSPLPDAITPSLLSEMRRPMWLTNEKADELLAFQRTPLRDGIRTSAAWFRQNESLPGLYAGERRFATY